jgi:hypothetical protein
MGLLAERDLEGDACKVRVTNKRVTSPLGEYK